MSTSCYIIAQDPCTKELRCPAIVIRLSFPETNIIFPLNPLAFNLPMPFISSSSLHASTHLPPVTKLSIKFPLQPGATYQSNFTVITSMYPSFHNRINPFNHSQVGEKQFSYSPTCTLVQSSLPQTLTRYEGFLYCVPRPQPKHCDLPDLRTFFLLVLNVYSLLFHPTSGAKHFRATLAAEKVQTTFARAAVPDDTQLQHERKPNDPARRSSIQRIGSDDEIPSAAKNPTAV